MEAVLYTENLYLYALVYKALTQAGWKVWWKEGQGLALAGLDQMEKGEVLLWPTPLGVRGYDPKAFAFLTRRDDPKTLPLGLRGQLGLRLLPGEKEAFLALGQGVAPRARDLAQALGLPRDRARFFLKGLRNKFGLGEEELVRLARHQVQVMGLQDHPQGLAGAEAEPLLGIPGEEEAKGYRAHKPSPVGQALGM